MSRDACACSCGWSPQRSKSRNVASLKENVVLTSCQFCHSRLVPCAGVSSDCASNFESVFGRYGPLQRERLPVVYLQCDHPDAHSAVRPCPWRRRTHVTFRTNCFIVAVSVGSCHHLGQCSQRALQLTSSTGATLVVLPSGPVEVGCRCALRSCVLSDVRR